MSNILDTTAIIPATRNSNRRVPYGSYVRNDQQELPRSEFWLNVGYDASDRFVNLPIGMPIGTMDPLPIRGQNHEWNEFTAARNALLEALKEIGAGLEPGAEIEIPNLVIKLRRVNEEAAVTDNRYSVDLMSLLAGGVPAGKAANKVAAE